VEASSSTTTITTTTTIISQMTIELFNCMLLNLSEFVFDANCVKSKSNTINTSNINNNDNNNNMSNISTTTTSTTATTTRPTYQQRIEKFKMVQIWWRSYKGCLNHLRKTR